MSLRVKRDFVPDELKEVYVDFYWSKEKLWKLDLPVSEIKIKELDWILDYPIWYTEPHSVPRIVLENSVTDSPKWKRIEAADLNFPIHVLIWKNRLLILDGIHRLVKAKMSGSETIQAKILSENRIEEILPTKEDFETGFLKQFKGL
jgi:hypothetical protein